MHMVYWDGVFNYSAINNYGATFAKGEYILLLSQYIEFQGKKDLEQLLANCQREKIGVVGARSYYRNHTIRHAGIGIGGEKFSYRLFEGLPNMCKGYMHREALQQELSAVSMECMMLRKSLLEQIDGFDDKLGDEFAAIDFLPASERKTISSFVRSDSCVCGIMLPMIKNVSRQRV